ncbi:hypothetical protein VUR80DRAFT_7525 [Thermomyces stellatus]
MGSTQAGLSPGGDNQNTPNEPPPRPEKRKANNEAAPKAKRVRRKKAVVNGAFLAELTGTGRNDAYGIPPQGSNAPAENQSHDQQGPPRQAFSQPGPSQQQNPGPQEQPGLHGGGGAGNEDGEGDNGGDGRNAQEPGLHAWRDFEPEMHPEVLPYFQLAQQQNVLLPEQQRRLIQERVLNETREQLQAADDKIAETHGRNVTAAISTRPRERSPVPRETYTVEQWPDACQRCLENGLTGCNIRQIHEQNPQHNPPKECDNCTHYRYDVANHPGAIDHECRFEPGPGRPLVTAERKRPVGQVVDFVKPLLWQCDHCAREGRYCDADRLMSVRCTACQDLKRDCTVRGSPPLRERDYLRALERGFRIMCRLCCKAGKKCSWTDSTQNYASGRPCEECIPFEADKQRYGACTTFSTQPVTAFPGGFNPLPIANVLPSLDEQGRPLFTLQRRPWRSRISGLKDSTRIRREGNGAVLVFKDPASPTWNDKEDRKKNPDGRKPCEFCYYTVTDCRPCESCKANQAQCDDITWGDGVFVADRHPGDREPTYYLSLGYGPGGLGTPKLLPDPTRMACGPKNPTEDGTPDYKMNRVRELEPKREERCREREIRLQQRYGYQYQEPGSGSIPPALRIDEGVTDPTARIGWPGSEILHEREPVASRVGPEWRKHPPGIANYPDAGIDGGGPAPDGLTPDPVHHSPRSQQPHQPPNDGGLRNPPEDDDGGLWNLPGADSVDDDTNGDGYDEFNASINPDGPKSQPPVRDPPAQGQQDQAQPAGRQPGQRQPAPSDEVLDDARLQEIQRALTGNDSATSPEVQPPGLNAFAPVQGQDPAPDAVQNGAPADPLGVFRLGTAFTGVERFTSRDHTLVPLVEDPSAREPPPEARGSEPRYPWSVPPDNSAEGNDRAGALQRIRYPGDNVLRDIPDQPTDGDNLRTLCMDRRAPQFLLCFGQHEKCCENLRHKAGSVSFPVCSACNLASKHHLFATDFESGTVGISGREILMMRAYFCVDCAEMAANPEFWHGRGDSVYGFNQYERGTADPAKGVGNPADGRRQGGWKSEEPLSITGCNCAEKLLGRVLCSYHRLFLAQKMIRQAAMMQEYRFRRYGSKICPNCQTRPGLDSSNAPKPDNIRRFWTCLVCNGVVASEEYDSRRQIGVTPNEVVAWYQDTMPPEELLNLASFTYLPEYAEEDFRVEVRDDESVSNENGTTQE